MPLRVRLTLYYTLFFGLTLLLLGTALYLLLRFLLLQSVVDELRVGSTFMQQAYAADPDLLLDAATLDAARVPNAEQHVLETPDFYIQVVDPSGQLLARTPNLRNNTLPLSAANRDRALAGQNVTPIEIIGTTRVQSVVVPLQVNAQTVGVVQVAQSLRPVDRALATVLWTLVGGGVLALLAAARGSVWLARSALQPIEQVSTTAATIMHAHDLQRRVPPVATNDEVGRLTNTVNAMLERLERSVTAQQQWTADVAHELRTPLTAIRGHLELLRRGAATDPALFNESLHDIESETLRLSRMANDLLLLAQADAGIPLRMSPVQLDELLAEVYREARPLAAHVSLRIHLDDALVIEGDRDRLKQALLNLVANALHHTPAGGTVTLTLQQTNGAVLLGVGDTGPGVPLAQHATIFDRFVRGDPSRARGGAGLGLAIVKWVAEAHGGRVLLESDGEHGSTFTIVLPQRLLTDHEAAADAANPFEAALGTTPTRPARQ